MTKSFHQILLIILLTRQLWRKH